MFQNVISSKKPIINSRAFQKAQLGFFYYRESKLVSCNVVLGTHDNFFSIYVSECRINPKCHFYCLFEHIKNVQF